MATHKHKYTIAFDSNFRFMGEMCVGCDKVRFVKHPSAKALQELIAAANLDGGVEIPRHLTLADIENAYRQATEPNDLRIDEQSKKTFTYSVTADQVLEVHTVLKNGSFMRRLGVSKQTKATRERITPLPTHSKEERGHQSEPTTTQG